MAQDEKREREEGDEQAKFELFLNRPEVYDEIYGKQTKEQAAEDSLFREDGDMIVPQSAEEVEEILALFRAQEAERQR